MTVEFTSFFGHKYGELSKNCTLKESHITKDVIYLEER
jgi:hypothetical protein